MFIRDTMSRAGSFTAVPGTGGIMMGLFGLAASIIAPFQPSPGAWLLTWILTAVVATLTGLGAVAHKMSRSNLSFSSPPSRRFILSFTPGVIAGALLTISLYQAGQTALLPGVWLLLYGISVVASGTFSVRVVPLMGFLFILLGAIALFTPPLAGAVCLGIGFGGLHIVFGEIVRRYHGG